MNCPDCNPPRVKSEPAGLESASNEPTASVTGLLNAPVMGLLEAQTLADLQAVERHLTTAGAAALHVARQLDAGGHSGSQTAALIARLLDAVEKAMAGARPVADALDELRDRRQRRAAGA